MIPIALELHNFLAYRDPAPLRLDGIHVACISGENGAGKSSLLDAMTWALWGRARSASADDLIHQNRRDTRVSLTFEMSGVRYRVTRQRSLEKKTALSLLDLQAYDPQADDWRPLSEHSLRATQDRINEILRLDYETFLNSALLAQGRADEFTAKPPAQRVQILAAILGLDRWAAYEERAKEKIRATRESITRTEGRSAELEKELSRRGEYETLLAHAAARAEAEAKRVAELETAWTEAERRRAAREDLDRQADDAARRLQAAQRELDEARAQVDALRATTDTEALEKSAAALETEREHLAARQPELESLQGKLRDLTGESGRRKGENDQLGPQTEPLKKRLETLETGIAPECPTCGQPLTPEHRHKVMADLRFEIEERREQYRENTARIKAITAEMDDCQKQVAVLQAALRGLPALEKRLAETRAALQAARDSAGKLPAAEERVARWNKSLAEEQAVVKKLEGQRKAAGSPAEDAVPLRAKLDAARLEKRLADERVGGARQNLAALDEMARQLESRAKELGELRASLSVWEELREAFGKRGVPTMVIETVVPELEQEANRLLSGMSAGRMRLRMETQRETKTGEARDTLDLFISDELGTRAYELYSGGEAFRINFAIRIALSKLLARRAGAQLRALFIDEGFGTQDAAGRERLVSAIQSIQDDFDRILVITHLDELREAFPARIEVTKTPDGSLVRVI